MAIKVVHMYDKLKDGVAFKIDRSTSLGNPFIMQVESMRDEVCDRYEEFIKAAISRKEPVIMKALNDIAETALKHDVYLQCWCAPKRCHGDVIKALIDRAIERKEKGN